MIAALVEPMGDEITTVTAVTELAGQKSASLYTTGKEMPESGFKIVKQTTLVHLDKQIQIVNEKATRHRQRFFYKFVNDTTNHMIQVADHIIDQQCMGEDICRSIHCLWIIYHFPFNEHCL